MLEGFSSRLIADRNLSIVHFVNEVMQGDGVRGAHSSERFRMRSRTGLGEHLARAHERVLKKQSVESSMGLVARARIHQVMKELRLTTETCIPLSTVLSRTVRRYQNVVHDHDALAKFLMNSLDTALDVAEEFATQVSRIHAEWSKAVSPRPGTVLAAAIEHTGRNGGLRSASLLEQTGANKSNVYRAIDELEAKGLIREVTGRKKDQAWLSPDLVDLISATVDGPH